MAGAGGTSWSQVEMHRAPTERLRRLAAAFADWGIPTAESLVAVRAVRDRTGAEQKSPLFASGGIRSGQDIAKCVALGADLVGLAGPFLKKAVQGRRSRRRGDGDSSRPSCASPCSARRGCIADLRLPDVLRAA